MNEVLGCAPFVYDIYLGIVGSIKEGVIRLLSKYMYKLAYLER